MLHRILWFSPFIFIIFFSVLAFISLNQSEIKPAETPLIHKNAPQTKLPLLIPDKNKPQDPSTRPYFAINQFKNHVLLVNFWGSWCPSCHDEHPFLMTLASHPLFLLIGMNFKDSRTDSLRFLNHFGNPFHEIAFDQTGQSALEWGVYGAPETFLINKRGQILYRHQGPLTPEIFNKLFLPILLKANKEPNL